MKVAILCQLCPNALRRIQDQHDSTFAVLPDDTEKLRLVEEAEVIVLRSPVLLDRVAIERAHRLRLVIRAGVGWDNIDRVTAAQRGIQMVSVPASAQSVAEHALGLMFALSRHISGLHRSLKEGHWEKHGELGRQLAGRTLGLVGFGRIGIRIAEITQSLNMPRIACDRSPGKPHKRQAASAAGVEFFELPHLFTRAEVISIQLPLNDRTRSLVGADLLGLMRPDALLVNVGRGQIVDEDALYRFLRDGRIAGAAADVFAHEPPGCSPLLELDNFVATPHVGAQTVEAQREIGEKVVQILDAFSHGDDLAEAGGIGIPVPPQEERE